MDRSDQKNCLQVEVGDTNAIVLDYIKRFHVDAIFTQSDID